MQDHPKVVEAARRRRRAAMAGHQGDAAGARQALADEDGSVRATALGALARLDALADDDVAAALHDPDPAVRRRACALAASHPAVDVVPLLDDAEVSVAEMAAWALGEQGGTDSGRIEALIAATAHADALVREAAVAALGALGDERGLPAILAAAQDKPAVRRRAVIALAAFSGPEVDAALQAALGDRDWQVRQAAEDLLEDIGPP
jgi:HEAT repeat protein